MKGLVYGVAVVLLIGFAYGSWELARRANYVLSYEAQVRQTVCAMVKPEQLREPCPPKAP